MTADLNTSKQSKYNLELWSFLQGPGAVVEGPKKGKGGAKKSGKVVKPWMRKKKPFVNF